MDFIRRVAEYQIYYFFLFTVKVCRFEYYKLTINSYNKISILVMQLIYAM